MRLQTERLTLRSWEHRDAVVLAPILADQGVRRFYATTLTAEQTQAQVDASIEKAATNGFHFGAAELTATGRFVGMLGLGYIPDDIRAAIPGNPEVEIGWQLDKTVWGHGLAPEGARAWLEYGFDTLGLREIVAFTYRGNAEPTRNGKDWHAPRPGR